MSKKVTLNAYAKINLGLEILKRRTDGFHEIMSIFQTISLHDRIVIDQYDRIEVIVKNASIPQEQNLGFKAAVALKEFAGCQRGAYIEIQKAIPISAGLGGGSTDAAAIIKGLGELWGLQLSHNDMNSIASGVGSDVPFFLRGGTAFVEGRGEKVRPIPGIPETWYFLLVPECRISEKTSTMFSMIRPDDFTKGFLTRKLESRLRLGGDLPPEFIFNGFDTLAQRVFPTLAQCKAVLASVGGKEAHLSGSGPALFCRVSNRSVGKAMQSLTQHKYNMRGYVVRSVEPPLVTAEGNQ